MKILLAVDGSECSVRAARKVAEDLDCFKQPPDIELLAVHLPIPHVPNMGLIVSKESVERYYREDCEQMLAPVRRALDEAGVKYTTRTLTGPIAETIVAHADAMKCDYMVLGTHGRTALGNMVLGSVATRVLHLAKLPVVLIH